MNNLIFGIITVLVSAFLFYRAYENYRIDNYAKAIFYVVLGGLVLRIFTSFDMYLHPWDERFHALVAKNFIKHPFIPTLYDNPVLPYSMENWGANHIWVHKQPLPMWFMAASMSVFGINEIALRVPSIVLSAIGIYLTYYIFKRLFGEREALLAAFFYSISGFIIEITAARVPTDHIDLFFLFFIEFAIFFVVVYLKTGKRYINILIGISIGCAILCKWLPALIVIPIWLILIWKKDSFKDIIINLFLILFFTSLVFLPWQIYIRSAFPLEAAYENQQLFQRFFVALDGMGGGPLHYLYDVQQNINVFVYIPMIWFIYITIKKRKEEKYWSILIWFLIPYIFFSIVVTKMQGYVLFVVPSIFLMISLFFWNMVDNIKKIKYPVLIKILLAGILIYSVYYCINRVKPFEVLDRNPIWALELKKLNDKIPEKKVVIFNIENYTEAMFYSDFVAYKILPTLRDVGDLKNRGYSVYIYDTGNLPDSLSKNPDVKLLKQE
jgi:4-amino-4-deoxy-L-arabinose transferase-like glycosyltransferase